MPMPPREASPIHESPPGWLGKTTKSSCGGDPHADASSRGKPDTCGAAPGWLRCRRRSAAVARTWRIWGGHGSAGSMRWLTSAVGPRRLGGSGDGSPILPHGGDDWARTRGERACGPSQSNSPRGGRQWRRVPHTAARRGWLGQESEGIEHVAKATCCSREARKQCPGGVRNRRKPGQKQRRYRGMQRAGLERY